LTYSGRFTHISGYPSAAGRGQDRESSLAKDRRSTTVHATQPTKWYSFTVGNRLQWGDTFETTTQCAGIYIMYTHTKVPKHGHL